MTAPMAEVRVSPPATNGLSPAGLDLRAHGLLHPGKVNANLSAAALTELALARGEGLLAAKGALVASIQDGHASLASLGHATGAGTTPNFSTSLSAARSGSETW